MYAGDSRWEITPYTCAAARRGSDGVLLTSDVLSWLREGSHEHGHALLLMETFGDQP